MAMHIRRFRFGVMGLVGVGDGLGSHLIWSGLFLGRQPSYFFSIT